MAKKKKCYLWIFRKPKNNMVAITASDEAHVNDASEISFTTHHYYYALTARAICVLSCARSGSAVVRCTACVVVLK